MSREASHRGPYQTKAAGPSASWIRTWVRGWRARVAYRLALLFCVLRLAKAVVDRNLPEDRRELRLAVEKAWPLVLDSDGSSWE